MTCWDDLVAVVFPIALRGGLPGWIGLALGLMKDTSLVLWIGIIELLHFSQSIVTRTQHPILVLGIAGAIYFAMSFPIARLGAARTQVAGPMIEIEDVHKSFGQLEVVKGVIMTVDCGEVVSIIGGSGSGKSTLLMCINGLEATPVGLQ